MHRSIVIISLFRKVNVDTHYESARKWFRSEWKIKDKAKENDKRTSVGQLTIIPNGIVPYKFIIRTVYYFYQKTDDTRMLLFPAILFAVRISYARRHLKCISIHERDGTRRTKFLRRCGKTKSGRWRGLFEILEVEECTRRAWASVIA